MKTQQILDVGIKAGEILLKSGAEIYRVEDTIARICKSYGLNAETFVLPTGIFISACGPEETVITITKRIKERAVNLNRIDLVNTFSRAVGEKHFSYEDAIKNLTSIENSSKYGFWTRFGAFGIAAFSFTLLVKGTFLDGISALLIGLLIFVFRELSSKISLFMFFDYFVAGILGGFFSLLASSLFTELNLYKIVIGSIMMLLPGVAITNSIKDALYGDLVASVARFGEAVLMVAALGAGVGFAFSIGMELIQKYV